MVALGAANLAGIVLFGALYAAAGARWISQAVFLACLPILFVGQTALWIRTERAEGRALEPLARLGRAVIGLVAAAAICIVMVLMPLFSLEAYLPPEAGVGRVSGAAMALVFITLVLTFLVNLAGAAFVVGSAFAARLRH
jgi:hypothetical protein